jgi:hypothetical protein
MRSAVARAVVVLAGLAGVRAFAQTGVPEVISFQGRLADANGDPVAGPVDVTCSLHAAVDATTAVWTETHAGVTPVHGLFTVMLGSVTPFASAAVDFGQELWLGIKFGDDDEMTPRFKLACAPYAMRAVSAAAADTAGDADTVDGVDAADLLDKATYDADGDGKVDAAATADTAADADTLDDMDSTDFANAARLAEAGGTLNDPANPADWSQLKNVPADIADGDDDTVYAEGKGILISGGTISADIGFAADQTAPGDHNHDATYRTKAEIDALLGEKAGTIHEHDADYVNTAGDTMTGALSLPADGLVVGVDQLVLSGGNLGVGTPAPGAKLEVAGGLKVSECGSVTLAAGSPNPDDVGDIIFEDQSGTQKGRIWTRHVPPGTSGLYLSSGDTTPDIGIDHSGNVGIGRVSAGAKLEVDGEIRLGAGATLFAPGALESCRIIWGEVNDDGTMRNGQGFTSRRTGPGAYQVVFNSSFPSRPVVVATVVANQDDNTCNIAITATGFNAWIRNVPDGVYEDDDFTFIAIGPR